MRKRVMHEPFLDQLRRAIASLKSMKPGEVHVLSVNAHYGRYQIMIGPESDTSTNRVMKGRPIEINGQIHHLFISPDAVRANPSHGQMLENLKHTIIMRDLSIHLKDPIGDGKHLADSAGDDDMIQAREYINLAGDEGEILAHRISRDRRMSMEAYQIVQEDIIRTLEEKKEDLSEATE